MRTIRNINKPGYSKRAANPTGRPMCMDCKRQRANLYSVRCNDCAKARADRLYAEAGRIVATGKCPKCGRKLRRNWSIAGWHQCEQYGAEGFRADASAPPCDFQCFTE